MCIFVNISILFHNRYIHTFHVPSRQRYCNYCETEEQFEHEDVNLNSNCTTIDLEFG